MEKTKLWESHKSYTKEFSTTTRQLAFASIAICWVLKPVEVEMLNTFPLLWAIAFASLYFICDTLQYASGAFVHYFLAKKCEKLDQDSIRKDPRYDWPAYLFLILKAMFLVASYGFILSYLVSH